MEEVATLIIRVQSDQADAAKKRLNDLGFSASRAETATGKLMSAWRGLSGLMAGTVGVGTAIAGLNKLVNVAKQFESLEAQLKTATGSAENAKVAFDALTDFATQTPFDLAQTVDAFIKLTNLGLTPSERAMRSYGNTASAMGKTLEDMVLAVSNATVGQFMNLRQFGIKAAAEADGIAFTFQGTTTKVKNSAKDIEEYFIALGEAKFGNSMSERMATLEGLISNLGDAWDQMFFRISKAGAGDLIKSSVRTAIDVISELTTQIQSGQLQAEIESIGLKFQGWGTDISQSAAIIEREIQAVKLGLKTLLPTGTGDFLGDAFKNFLPNVRAYARLGGVLWGTWTEFAEISTRATFDFYKSLFNALITVGTSAGKELYQALNPFEKNTNDFTGATKKAIAQFTVETLANFKQTKQALTDLNNTFGETVTVVLNDRDATVKASDDKSAAAKRLREEYEKTLAIDNALTKFFGNMDRLSRFGIGGHDPSAEFREQVKAMRTHAQVLQETYEQRRALIIDNTEKESDLRRDLLGQLESTYDQERKQLLDKSGLDLEVRTGIIEDQNAVELEIANNGFMERQIALDEALDAKLISEEEHNRRSEQLQKRHNAAIDALVRSQSVATRAKQFTVYAEVLSMGADMAAQIERIAQQSGKGAKAAFYLAKAIAIAQMIVSTELAAMQSMADPTNPTIFGKIAAHTAIRALGYGSVALVAAQAIAGYEDGGIVPGNSMSGDKIPARVNSREMILTTGQQRELWDMANGGGGSGSNVTVNVINEAGAQIETREREGSNGKVVDVIVRRVRSELNADAKGGSAPWVKSFADAYGLRRGA